MSDPLVAWFDARPEAYDRQIGRERRALRAAAAVAAPGPGACVVDLATGTGALAAELAARRPGRLIAVDAAPRMLARARMRLGDAATIILADVRDVPLADDVADVVTAGYLLHLLDPPARAAALAEVRRLLRPGGVFVAVVHGSPPGAAGRVHRAAWRVGARLRRGAVVGGGPLADVPGVIAGSGLRVERARTVPGAYWSIVVGAREPVAPGAGGAVPG